MKVFINRILKSSCLVILSLFICALSFAEQIKIDNIKISGNSRISNDTILKNILVGEAKFLESSQLNEYQKILFGTEFFSNVEFNYKNNILNIFVKENPLVNFIYYDGLKDKSETLKEIEKLTILKERNIFNPSRLKQDINSVKNFLYQGGYLSGSVNYKLFEIEDNKINIIYQIDMKKKFNINHIFFIGNKHFKSSDLRNAVRSREHGWWKFLSNTTVPTAQSINYDISLLKKFYTSEGFYDVQITSSDIIPQENSMANLVFSINSGKKYFFKEIEFTDTSNSIKGNKNISKEIEKFLKKYKNKNYSPLAISKMESYIDKIVSFNNLNLKVESKILKLTDDSFSVKFFTNAVLGNSYISSIKIYGNQATEERVIRNNLLLNEGDFFDKEKIDRSIDLLKSTTIFKNVDYEVISINGSSNKDIKINVVEQATGEISAGAGIGTNGASLSAGIKEKNFLGKGITTSIDASIGTDNVIGTIDITNPDFLDSGKILYTSAFSKKNTFDNVGYENKIMGGSVGTSYNIYENLNLKYGASLDSDSLTASSTASNLIKLRAGDYLTSKFYYNLNNDQRNKKFMTTEGYTIGFGQSLATLISDAPFLENRFFGSYYSPLLTENFIGSAKFQFQSINALDEKDVKLSDRLFVGSDNLRGFASRGVGPNIGNDYIGGNYSFYTNFSSTLPNGTPDSWNAVTNVFFDVANVWGVDYTDTVDESNKIRSSVGLGLSWVSPIGPIGLSYAQPISKKSSDNIKNFQFKIGSVF